MAATGLEANCGWKDMTGEQGVRLASGVAVNWLHWHGCTDWLLNLMSRLLRDCNYSPKAQSRRIREQRQGRMQIGGGGSGEYMRKTL
jgi:hypothetical protein